uniref:BZIP2 protein n=1 Tax=Craterostigma plantagineum TaxID=4153 RepID=Q3YMQ8_CRAPL|nr:bZIP2 protein [Craterostigma plantagineum]
MATNPRSTSPLSDIDGERQRKRKLSNRESARRSRMRKQQRLDELTAQATQLKEENKKLREMIDGSNQLYLSAASENSVLRAQAAELADRLKSLNTLLRIASDVSGLAFDIPDVPDALAEPWQMPCAVLPVAASADMFQY